MNAHVAIRGGLATVWIRDAHLTLETLGHLEREIRARLRAFGARLEELFVNGQRVDPIDAPPHPLHDPMGGQDGD